MSLTCIEQGNSDEEVSFVSEAPQNTFRAYPLRWIVVLMFAFINSSNAFLWISYAPVADHFATYYETEESVLNWILLIFPFTTIFFGLPAALIADWLGIRVVLLTTASWNLICGILRTVSSAKLFTSSYGSLALLIVGNFIASFGQPLCMFSSTKLAIDWFPEKQRTTANNIASLGNSIGVLLGSILAPYCVREPDDIPIFDYVSLCVVAVGFLLTLILIRRNKPLTPPSVAATILVAMQNQNDCNISRCGRVRHRLTIFKGHLVTLLSSLSIGSCLLLITFSTGVAYFTALSSLFQQILCAKNYSNQFAGLCGALLIVGGLCTSILAAYVVDRTGRLLESTKVCFAIAVVFADGLATAIWFSGQHGLIIFFVLSLGAFGFSQYSMSLELAAEATFPIPVTITSGLLIIGSQVLAVIFILVLQAVAPYVPPSRATMCDLLGPAKDYSHPNLIICGLMTLLAVVQLFALQLPYKRREASEAAKLDIKCNTTIPVPPVETDI